MNWRLCILFLAVMIGTMCPAVALCQDRTPAQDPIPQHPLPNILDSLRHYAQQRETMQKQYEANLKSYRHTMSCIRYTENKGRAEGRVEVAKALKAKGVDVAIICETTKLSAEEVGKL